MNKKILLLGAQGLLGNALKHTFRDHNEIYCMSKDSLDITNKDAVDTVVEYLKPELIINAAAYSNVDGAEDNKELAMKVNGEAVGHIADSAKQNKAVVVHYSTDYIFDGTKKSGYDEDDAPTGKPVNAYGESKLLGEQELQKYTDKFYIIRTSWLFGPGRDDFLDAMFRLAQEKDKFDVVNDQYGKPTYGKDLAEHTRKLCLDEENDFGVYHFSNEEDTNWYEYAKFAIDAYGSINNWDEKDYPEINPVSSDEFKRRAKRPEYSILNNNKFEKLRPWKEAVEEYLSEYKPS